MSIIRSIAIITIKVSSARRRCCCSISASVADDSGLMMTFAAASSPPRGGDTPPTRRRRRTSGGKIGFCVSRGRRRRFNTHHLVRLSCCAETTLGRYLNHIIYNKMMFTPKLFVSCGKERENERNTEESTMEERKGRKKLGLREVAP